MFEEFDDWPETALITHFVFQKCAECQKYPSSACHIKPFVQGGEPKFYNYIPLCVKHTHEFLRLGSIAMMAKYVNVCSYILAKGWVQDKTLSHPNMNGAN